jgi:cyclohexanone monooxygenase
MIDAGDGPRRDSLDEILAKYRSERDKRLRPEGAGQYRELAAISEDFDRDPYADPDFEREPVCDEADVAIIGGGLGGMIAAARLVQQGVTNFCVIDKAGDFGGTWYWNRYPGAACDTESYIYLPLLEETGYIPVEKYSKASEIFTHCQRIANQFDLYPKALFQTVVKDVRWIDDSSRWEITTDREDRIRARFVIIAGGILHKAKLPGIPGIESFKGKSFHTSRWDYDYTGGSPTDPMTKLADKRVALIGTGATGVQVMPKLAEAARQLYVFQRTPAGVGVRGNQPTDPEWAKALKPGWQDERMENFTRIVSGQPVEQDLVGDGWTEIFSRNPNAFGISRDEEQLLDLEAMEAIRARVDDIVADPATAAALKPWYNRMCKRPCFHDEYLPAFNRPNVNLLDTGGKGVECITEDAIVVDGVSYPVDCIVYASGFETGSPHTSRLGFEIHGRNGVSLTNAWASSGPATLHGMHARGFPNLMVFQMLQGGLAINFAHLLSELAAHAAELIAYCVETGIEEIEPSAEAQEAWFQTLLGHLGAQGAFLAECTPSYFNGEGGGNGQARLNPAAVRAISFFGPVLEYIQILRDWRAAGTLAGLETRRGLIGDKAQ